jgi:hypothetical protein
MTMVELVLGAILVPPLSSLTDGMVIDGDDSSHIPAEMPETGHKPRTGWCSTN